MGIKLHRDSLSQGGGILNDVDGKITGAAFTMYTYPDKAGNATRPGGAPSLHLTIEVEEGKAQEQYWSCGDAKFWKPVNNGKELEYVGPARSDERKDQGPSKGSNFGLFLSSLFDALDADKLAFDMGDDITGLVGMTCHWVQIPAPKRANMNRAAAPVEGAREKTIVVVDKVVSLPNGGGAKSGSASDEIVQETLTSILNAAPNKTLNIAQIAVKGFAVLGSKPVPEKQAIVNRMKDTAFLKSFDGMLWTYDPAGGKVVGL